MRWLVEIFVASLGKVFAFFAGFLSKKTAQVLLAVTLAVTVTAALFVALGAALSAIVVASPGGFVDAGISLLPANTNICIATVITVKAAAWLYDWQIRVIQWSQV